MNRNNSYGVRRNVLKELSEGFSSIHENFRYFSNLSKTGYKMLGASEWLLDNIYLIEREYKAIKIEMPIDYFNGLKTIGDDNGENIEKLISVDRDNNMTPRIFLLAKNYIQGRNEIECDKLINYVNKFQSEALKDTKNGFTTGELWAFPLMLKTAIIISLSKYTDELVSIQKESIRGRILAEEIIDIINGGNFEEKINNLNIPSDISNLFLRDFFNVLRENSVEEEKIYDLIENKIQVSTDLDRNNIKSNLKEQVLEGHIGDYITAIRKIEGISWHRFFQETSLVEMILKKDPAKVYNNMDFESKDYYRHQLENLAKDSGLDEIILANKILECAENSKNKNEEDYKRHVGYYLIDDGVKDLIKFGVKGKKTISKNIYVFFNIIGTILISFGLLLGSSYLGIRYTLGEYIISFLLILNPISEIIIALTNYSVAKLIPIRLTPKLDLKNGIPKGSKTVVVIPAIINSKEKVKELMDKLEVVYCGNRDKNVYFALLSDFYDCDNEKGKKDIEIIKKGIEVARDLNEKYVKDFEREEIYESRFFFLSRKRIFNEKQNIFMGRERKRGKLMEFMALIRGDKNHTFNVFSSDINQLKDVKYLVTLDEDTFMPRESIFKLVGAMSHILNIPHLKDKMVVRGYGVMQPKVSISLEAKNKTYFSRIFGGEEGVDGYSVAYSDTYEDLFGEGSFTGKGIINIDEFYKVLSVSIKDNTVLSHDLIEGSLTRCALVSDIEFIDDYPSSYESSCMRLHRWVRGDWQLIGWLFSNKINILSKWKIFDNLRRSLLSLNLLLAIILSTAVLNAGSQIILLAFLALTMPLICVVTDFVVTPKNRLMGAFKSFEQLVLIASFIPYQAFLMFDAIVVTLSRVFISKKNLLEWQSADIIERNSSNKLSGYLRRMWISPLMGLFILYLSLNSGLGVITYNTIVAGLWILSPYIAYSISLKTRQGKDNVLKEDEKIYLRKISRRIYAYYEDFVNEENNYLAPDNYQEKPFKGIANRTSPTNIGMGITSNIVAYDLGYITMTEFIEKIELILDSMKTLKKINGHYLNWYDTRTKEPLWPRYISTVDSGNLLASLWILKKTVSELKDNKIIRKKEIYALNDVYKIIEEEQANFKFKFSTEINSGNYINTLNEVLFNIKEIRENSKVIKLKRKLKEKNNNNILLKESKKLNKEEIIIENEEAEYWIDKCIDEVYGKIKHYNYVFEGLDKIYSKEFFEGIPSITELIHRCEEHKMKNGDNFKNLFGEKIANLKIYINKIDNIIIEIDNISKEMNFDFLYDKTRGLFHIGYNVEEKSLGNSYYDLLASESRIASFISISKNDVPASHWFKLGRAMTNAFHTHSLVSWSGTMFEYFMPSLIMKNYPKTLFSQTYESVIKAQKSFAKQKKIPWGISESAFYQFDSVENYQYKAFGVPGLGLKRGLEDEIVISPYSTLMTIPFNKEEAIKNLKEIEKLGALGRYGFIEALDYTKFRKDNYVMTLSKRNLINNNERDEEIEFINPVDKYGDYVDNYKKMVDNKRDKNKKNMWKNNVNNVDNVDKMKKNVDENKNIRDKGHLENKSYPHKMDKVVTYMVHHLGMSLMALDNTLFDNILVNRFHGIPEIKATELLLKEKVPHNVIFERNDDFSIKSRYFKGEVLVPRTFDNVKQDNTQIVLLSNGEYSSMITVTGSGYSKKNDTMLYRWRGNSTNDNSGMFFYIKNLNSNDYWSSTFEPCKTLGDKYVAEFTLDKAKFIRLDGNIKTSTEIVVDSEEDFEVRKLTLENLGDKGRSIEITSYMEITLSSFSADAVHPTFSNLFVQTEYDKEREILIGSRRPRVKNGKIPYIFHKVISEEEMEGHITYETSRINFIGRNRELNNPRAMDNDKDLDNTVGTVLDPIMSIRTRVRLEANSKINIYYITGICDSKEHIFEICNENNNVSNVEKVFKNYSINTQLELKALGIRSSVANNLQSAASSIFFLNNVRKNREDYIKNISKHQKDLWAYGISGDLPIIMLSIEKEEEINLMYTMVKFHNYLKLKGVKADLIVYNNEESSYDEPLQKNILEVIRSSNSNNFLNKSGGIFVYNKSTMAVDIKDLLIGISRIYVDKYNQLSNYTYTEKDFNTYLDLDGEGLSSNIALRNNSRCTDKYKLTNKNDEEKCKDNKNSYNLDFYITKEAKDNKNDSNMKNIDKIFNESNLDFFNGYGGFSKEDKSYIIKLSNHKNTPAPWINVISNDDFGFHISESGAGYTWCGNSRENKITPWSNDYVKDPVGEALYIKDNKTKKYFSITPKPVRDSGEYIIVHGFGYSQFYHTAYDIKGKLEIFAPKNERVKIQIVTLENLSNEERDISLVYYAKLVLGVHEYESSRYVSTYLNNNSENIFLGAHNPYSEYFGKLNAYLTIIGGKNLSFTGDNKEFLGISGEMNNPQALDMNNLSNNTGGAYDPCLAVKTNIILKPREKKTLVILFGQDEIEKIEDHIQKYRVYENVKNELDKVKQYWSNFLGNIQVKTPDKSLDYLLNGWLLYQTLSCRYLSRSAFYQSGGAYGFRDQLQDSMSLGVVDPKIPKAQILRSASRQYVEGDVQHWWHPVVNSGIRTRFSDDLLWLPYVTAEYIASTGDYNILDEMAPYLEDEPLREGEDERYTIVNQSSKEGSIYEHCLKAIEKSLKFGVHNIPLMGSGDWNDGMSTVGNEGKGESVWLGWFLYSILDSFIKIADKRNDLNTKEKFEVKKKFILENIEKNAWDGGWYRRAYFDDGTPLGSRENPECRIDSLAQSWSIISGAGKLNRSIEAMEAVDRNLVKKDKGMILLLAPPFGYSKLEPGYIKGYVPGVRENGGQYTHAAVWVILALTKLGMGDKAAEYYNMINPINHSKTELEAMTYKVEPYVMSADVYIKEPHAGRGGWSWYTGASGWMYRVGIEDILGLKKIEDKGYIINPCIPKWWNEFEIKIKNEKEDYHIKVLRIKDETESSSEKSNSKYAHNNSEVNNHKIKEEKYTEVKENHTEIRENKKLNENSQLNKNNATYVVKVTANEKNLENKIIPRNKGKLEILVYLNSMD